MSKEIREFNKRVKKEILAGQQAAEQRVKDALKPECKVPDHRAVMRQALEALIAAAPFVRNEEFVKVMMARDAINVALAAAPTPTTEAQAGVPVDIKIEVVTWIINKHMSTTIYPREVAAAAQEIVQRYCSTTSTTEAQAVSMSQTHDEDVSKEAVNIDKQPDSLDDILAGMKIKQATQPVGYFYKHGDEWLQDKYGDHDAIPLYR